MGWHFLAATAAGASIWATHFIAIIAFHAGTPVSFDPVLTIISLLVAMTGSLFGFIVAGMIRTSWTPALGGVITGISIAVMHYSGMLAYVAQGSVEWDRNYIVASVLLAMTLTALAMHVSVYGGFRHSKLTAVALLTAAIISLHFTGMAAFKLTPMVIYDSYSNPAAMQAMALAIGLVSLMIVGSVLASYLIDDKSRNRSMRQLQHMALSDALTGLANRAGFGDQMDDAIKTARRAGSRFMLASIDLDRFKEINDLHGHSAGDAALQTLAQRMREFDNGGLFVARLGGDEFAVIAPYDVHTDAVTRLARLRDDLIKPFTIDDKTLSVGASFGVCVFPRDAEDRETLVNHTDLALYRAKTEIAEKICFFDNVMDEAIKSRRNLANDLRKAIEHNELEVYYQVQTQIVDSSVSGYEALLRWHHPRLGMIPPSEFIPLAEENGLILQLGEWVLRRACSQCAPLGIKVAVNLSPIQFLHPNLPGLVADILADTKMNAEYLELELTESAIIQDKERTLLQLQQIRKLGVTIALDDFGTGYSSLETLRAFPFDKIKLDRTFMDEIETSAQARSIIRAVLSLGRSLEIPVLAEGIETSKQLEILAEEGCNAAQGYLLGRPAPMAQILSTRADAAEELRLATQMMKAAGTSEAA